MFQIKICGITSPKDAQWAALAGADAIGLNFYEKSKRFISPEAAESIVKVVPERVSKVGLFVNSPVTEIRQIADRLGLDSVQLHGDEPPEDIAALGNRVVLRAFRCTGNGFAHIGEYLESCRATSCLPSALLLDAHITGQYGGTGQVADWDLLSGSHAMFAELPLVLAGGLTPFNVSEAIAAVRPNAVDSATGVESAPGKKDLMMLRAFVTASKKAFAALDS